MLRVAKIGGAFLLFLFGLNGFGQKYRILQSNPDYERVRIVQKFDYLHEDFDTAKYEWVADYKITLDTIYNETIQEVFMELKERANRMGANAFRVKESDIYVVHEERYIIVSVYWLRMEHRDENMTLFKSGDVYLFGFLAHHVVLEGYEVEYEGAELLMEELSYKRFDNKEKGKAHLRIGGRSRGDSKSIKISNETLPNYFYFRRTTGTFQNSWIGEYDWSFGEFLIRILDKA